MKATFRDRTENNRGSEGCRLNICRGWRFNDPRGYRRGKCRERAPSCKVIIPRFYACSRYKGRPLTAGEKEITKRSRSVRNDGVSNLGPRDSVPHSCRITSFPGPAVSIRRIYQSTGFRDEDCSRTTFLVESCAVTKDGRKVADEAPLSRRSFSTNFLRGRLFERLRSRRNERSSIHPMEIIEGASVSTNVLPIMAPVDKLFENIIRVHVGKVKRF